MKRLKPPPAISRPCKKCGGPTFVKEAWQDDDGWQSIDTKPPFVRCEERGIYTDTDGDGLFYFKPTHWR